MRYSLFTFVLLLLMLIGCGVQQEAIENTAYPDIADIQVTIDAEDVSVSPYAFATSKPGFVTLHGRLIVLDPLSILPAEDDAIYLAPVDPDAPIATIPIFEEGSVPQAEVDERTGEFVFTNISAGRYAVVVITMGGTQMPVRRMSDGSLAIVDIVKSDTGRAIDLGELTLP